MRNLFFIAVVTFLACNSTTTQEQKKENTNPDETDKQDEVIIDSTYTSSVKLFTAATAVYIKEILKSKKTDTLFLSRNPDFPNITLPTIIEGIPVQIIVTEEGHRISKRRPMTILNLIDLSEGEFMIVTFKDGFIPQFNTKLYFHYNKGEFKLDSLETTYPYTKK